MPPMTTAATTADPQDTMTRASGGSEFVADGPSFQEAARAAVEEHSKAAEAAAAEHAGRAGDSTVTEGDEGDEAAKAVAAAKAKGTTTAADKGTTTETTPFLTQEEYTALETAHKGDPAALYKGLEKAFTQKTQKLAVERKEYERVSPYVDLIEAYETDAEGVLRLLAEQNGLQLVKKDGTTVAATTDAATVADPAEVNEAVLTEIRAEFGEELDYLADPVARAVARAVEKLTGAQLEAVVKPLQEAEARRLDEQSAQTTKTIMTEFGETRPDWKTHEPAMLELSQKLQPGKGMTEHEYLDHLYTLVTTKTSAATREADIQKEADKRAAKIVEKMRTGADTHETVPRSMPDNKVTTARPENATIRDSWEAAKRGEKWDT